MLDTTRMRFPLEVIFICIRWYAAYLLSYRHLEEMMRERGVVVGHSSTIHWANKFLLFWKKYFANINAKSTAVGGWMKPT